MTPDELRSLADEASPGPWRHGRGNFYGSPPDLDSADAQLLAITHDLARLCAELGEALHQQRRSRHDHSARSRICVGCHADNASQVALAKLSELKPAT